MERITMMNSYDAGGRNRRAFLKDVILGGACLASGPASALAANIAPEWKNEIGLELYTVRDLLEKDYEGTLARVASIGYKQVEPADPYNHMRPEQYKALLDKYHFRMYSTHADATDGPGLEKELEGQAKMGLKYTAVQPARQPAHQRTTIETVKRRCAQMNKYGVLLKKFGMKHYVHNHAGEFDVLDDGKTTEYDVLLRETDPALVAMQLDIGWAYVAGQDVLEMFRKTPGRFELWHVKDAKFKHLDPKMKPSKRQGAGKIVTLGEGDIDYKAVFAQAKVAGLKHFVIEQDTAGADGRDAVADCKIAYDNLKKILS
ncbi:MAG TPA: sugar phosphate isomerase/epimerase [Bryobacteraceae bacterium]|nr:sugar phosphate isomerase/epimerase [Bryobacteraceae bacterium]